jgi:hypothetical protein
MISTKKDKKIIELSLHEPSIKALLFSIPVLIDRWWRA